MENTRVKAAHDALRDLIFTEPLDIQEYDILTEALAILYSRLPK